MSPLNVKRLGVVMEPRPGDPMESGGVLNPGGIRGPDGEYYLFPRLERVKALMLRRAFGCGFRRIEFRVDARNGRSQAAMAKIGGIREGVIRQDQITWNGHVRDTVLFSILADEWRSTAG